MKLPGHKSITFRLTLLFALASTVVLLLLGFLIGNSVEHHFEEQDMEVLTAKMRLTQHAFEKLRSKTEFDALPQQLDDSLIGNAGLAVAVATADGQILFATTGAEFPQALLDRQVEARSGYPITWKTRKNQPLRGIVSPIQTGIKDAPPVVVAVAIDISHHEHFMSSFRTTLWSVVILAALLTGFLGWVAVKRGLAPLKAIRQEVAAINAHRLDARLPADSVPIELAELTNTLNDMLARLENSFKRLSDFSSDLAHELRTPVSNLLTQTQVTLSKLRSADEYRDVMASNAEEFERLSRIIADMLFLAKSDNDLAIPHREPINLRNEVEEIFEFYEALAEEKSVALTCTGKALISGDKLMLRRAISNLLSNAIRHTPAGGSIEVHLDDTDSSLVKLSVQNTGEPIPPEHLPRLFDRFYRVDAARKNFGEGAGLGLAITRSIARAHGGEAFVQSEGNTTEFEIQLPNS